MSEIRTQPDGLDRGSDAQVLDETEETRLLSLDSGKFAFAHEIEDWAVEFHSELDARLYWGLWKQTGGFHTHARASQYIPVEVVRAGKDAVAAYLTVGCGYKRNRSQVASTLGITEQAVSNYCNRIRWSDD